MSFFSNILNKLKELINKYKPTTTTSTTTLITIPIPTTTQTTTTNTNTTNNNGKQDTVFFVKDKEGWVKGGSGRNSLFNLLSFNLHSHDKDKEMDNQRNEILNAMRLINPNCSWAPMLFLNNDSRGIVSPFPGARYNNLLGNGRLNPDLIAHWCAVWWVFKKFSPSMVLACGDDLNKWNDPDSSDWQKAVKIIGEWYETDMKNNGTYPNSVHSVTASWEAEKLVGKDVKKLQRAIDYCRKCFPSLPVSVHLTDPDLVKGLSCDFVQLQSYKHPYNGDELSDSDLINWIQRFHDSNPNLKYHATEFTTPLASKYNHQRDIVRKSGLVIGVGW